MSMKLPDDAYKVLPTGDGGQTIIGPHIFEDEDDSMEILARTLTEEQRYAVASFMSEAYRAGRFHAQRDIQRALGI